MQKKAKIGSLVLALVLSFSLIPAAVAASAVYYTDVEDGAWYTDAILQMVDAGIIPDDGFGNVQPSRPLTRREAGIMIARAFGLDNLTLEDAVTGVFDDVQIADPYISGYINSVVAAGFMDGSNGKFKPNQNLSRAEAIGLMAKALGVADAPEGTVSAFNDFNEVPAWAKGFFLNLEYAGMINGSNGKVNPIKATFSRAEMAVLLSNMLGVIIDDGSAYEDATIEGNAIIRNAGVHVTGLTVNTLIIAEGVGDGDVILEGCEIGELIVRGGGSESIHLINSTVDNLIINASLNNTHVDVDIDSTVENAGILSGSASITGTGAVTKVSVSGSNAKINLPNTEIVIAEDVEGTLVGGEATEAGQTVVTVSEGKVDDGEEEPAYVSDIGTVHESVTAEATVESETELNITITGELAYEDNVFLTTSKVDHAGVLTEDGKPLPEVLGGAFTALEINLKEILTALGFETVDIEQTNAALAAYGAGGSITETDGVWKKNTSDRAVAEWDDAFTLLVLGSETVTIVFTEGEKTFTVTIDATDLTVNAAPVVEPPVEEPEA